MMVCEGDIVRVEMYIRNHRYLADAVVINVMADGMYKVRFVDESLDTGWQYTYVFDCHIMEISI